MGRVGPGTQSKGLSDKLSNTQVTAATTEESTKPFPVRRVHVFHNACPKNQNHRVIKVWPSSSGLFHFSLFFDAALEGNIPSF